MQIWTVWQQTYTSNAFKFAHLELLGLNINLYLMASILITLLNLIPPVPGKKAVQWCQLCQLLSKSRSIENFLSFLVDSSEDWKACICVQFMHSASEGLRQTTHCVCFSWFVCSHLFTWVMRAGARGERDPIPAPAPTRRQTFSRVPSSGASRAGARTELWYSSYIGLLRKTVQSVSSFKLWERNS